MVGWHHQLGRHEFEQALGDGDGQGVLACCSPWGHKESDTTEQLNSTATTKIQCSQVNKYLKKKKLFKNALSFLGCFSFGRGEMVDVIILPKCAFESTFNSRKIKRSLDHD